MRVWHEPGDSQAHTAGVSTVAGSKARLGGGSRDETGGYFLLIRWMEWLGGPAY